MVDFCPDCASLLHKKNMDGKHFLFCRCGYNKELGMDKTKLIEELNQKKNSIKSNLIIVSEEEKVSIYPIVKKDCLKCGYGEAEAWQEQTRSADEPSTSFFRCVRCKFTWREY
jgi:DNA-directed RNA polymerase subunit M